MGSLRRARVPAASLASGTNDRLVDLEVLRRGCAAALVDHPLIGDFPAVREVAKTGFLDADDMHEHVAADSRNASAVSRQHGSDGADAIGAAPSLLDAGASALSSCCNKRSAGEARRVHSVGDEAWTSWTRWVI